MNKEDDLIKSSEERIRNFWGSEEGLYKYLFETMENFFYRYLETMENKDLKISELGKNTFGAVSFESSMVEALKIKNPTAHSGILELAKRIPKKERPMIKLTLQTEIKEFTTDKGHLIISSIVDWGHPDFSDATQRVRKDVTFKYDELGEYRKKLAQKLEEAAELFT